MVPPTHRTFIVDCDTCKAKVAAIEGGRADWAGMIDEAGEPFGERLFVGTCPQCRCLLAGHATQLEFENFNSYQDHWSDVVRVYPRPSKAFLSKRIPRAVTDSLVDADRSIQANANIAACAMFGRALEALCRDVLKEPGPLTDAVTSAGRPKAKRPLMLGSGIAMMRDKKIIDDRLFDWSQQLYLFRNSAAHPEDIAISREDAEDLQTFVYAIVEYIYDLTDRYNEFKARKEERARTKKS